MSDDDKPKTSYAVMPNDAELDVSLEPIYDWRSGVDLEAMVYNTIASYMGHPSCRLDLGFSLDELLKKFLKTRDIGFLALFIERLPIPPEELDESFRDLVLYAFMVQTENHRDRRFSNTFKSKWRAHIKDLAVEWALVFMMLFEGEEALTLTSYSMAAVALCERIYPGRYVPLHTTIEDHLTKNVELRARRIPSGDSKEEADSWLAAEDEIFKGSEVRGVSARKHVRFVNENHEELQALWESLDTKFVRDRHA